MNKISKNFKINSLKNSVIKNVKVTEVPKSTIKKTSNLERIPVNDYFDFSTEELGYFTRREKKTGKILEVINIIFPR